DQGGLKDDSLFGPKDDSLFGPAAAQPVADPFAGMGEVDQSPALDQAMAWPDSSRQELIPDDWADDLLGNDVLGNDALAGEPLDAPAPQAQVVAPAPRPQAPQPGLRARARPTPAESAPAPSAGIAEEQAPPVQAPSFDSPPEVPV